ncbi:LptA/OstA family protein [Pseudanabaena sp. PCC 6802]|uniref:LptA/OstA family protein n=1 Tax=Pseudanabaena sp. PCC 6802 TaxID=118173 RepID=UPI00034D41A9|nr:LptA/OstA family protein [Pseudanabaena sp. PCC 6802]
MNESHLKHQIRYRKHLLLPLAAVLCGISVPAALGQNTNTALTIRADIQEANSRTGIVTARGNVRMNYPARQINATSRQAQYFSKERRIVLSGNVIVIQEGNSIKAETITYLIDEGKFQALPPSEQQVESVYIVPDEGVNAENARTTPVTQIKPAFKSPDKSLVSPTSIPTSPKQDATIEPVKPADPDRKNQEVKPSNQPNSQ